MGIKHSHYIEKMIAEEIERIKNETYKASKLSKKSQEIVNTSVFHRLITIFKALDADSNGIISEGDLEKALSGKLGTIFRPLAAQIAKHHKSIDLRTFENCFRDFLRVLIV
jgi:Ca2+-binding EF-hand superfamily protein